MMKNRPIHENLDTSFVNLSALFKYLRRRQFVGNVMVQLNGYRAEIELRENNQVRIREHDQISGRISEGEEAMQRLLIRAREPGGTINVYQLSEQVSEVPQTEANIPARPAQRKPPDSSKQDDNLILQTKNIKPVEGKLPANGASRNGTSTIPKPKLNGVSAKEVEIQKPQKPKNVLRAKKNKKELPDFPFTLHNRVEDKAKQNSMSDKEWQVVLNLTVELLAVVERSLAEENLDLTAAFRKVRSEIADDYPFMNPRERKFEYSHGKIKMTEKINAKIFIASIMESLRRIMNRLEENPKFKEVHRRTAQTIIALMNKRRPDYEKFEFTPPLKKILGI